MLYFNPFCISERTPHFLSEKTIIPEIIEPTAVEMKNGIIYA